MSDRDDDGPDDPMLRQMRAVWLSMRDEEPPQSGVSALLAAAREKADQMRPTPSLWSRFLAGMRRPPVLALATVVVLLGGAVALTMRGDVVEGDNPQVQAPAMPSPVQPPAEPPASAVGGAEQDELAKRNADQQAPARVAQEAQPAPPPAIKSAPPRQRRQAEPPKAATNQTVPPDRGFGGDGVAGRIDPAVPAVPAPPKPQPKAGDEKKAEGKLSIATDDAAPRSEPAGAPAEEPTASAEAPAKPPPTAQLVQQCETAAARGDCAAVRVMAERIKKLDVAVYRARVEKNATIARCLK